MNTRNSGSARPRIAFLLLLLAIGIDVYAVTAGFSGFFAGLA